MSQTQMPSDVESYDTSAVPTREMHEYLPSHRAIRSSLVSSSTVTFVFVIGSGGLLVAGVLQELNDPYRGIKLVILLGFMLLVSLQTGAVLITTADILIADDGIHLFPGFALLPMMKPWQMHISREQIARAKIMIKRKDLPQFRHLPCDSLDETVHIVRSGGFSVLGVLAAIFYFAGLRPIFVITPQHEQRDTIIQHIRELRDRK
jgi:hypothetical protein